MKTRITRRPKSGKPHQHQAAKKRITPAEARRRAAKHCLRQMFASAVVRDGAKVRLSWYCVAAKLAGKPVWIVYPKSPEPGTEIRSAHIIAVCQRTGKILYAGSAHDEG